MNITITGNLGSGKSSVCKELETSGFTIISAGDIFRQLAQEKGMTVIELNEAAKKDRSIDDMLDARSTQLGKTMDHTVFDSRLAWHFVEKSFKVFLLVDTQEAARRVYEGNSRSAEEYRDIAQARHGLEERARLEQERFLNYTDWIIMMYAIMIWLLRVRVRHHSSLRRRLYVILRCIRNSRFQPGSSLI